MSLHAYMKSASSVADAGKTRYTNVLFSYINKCFKIEIPQL